MMSLFLILIGAGISACILIVGELKMAAVFFIVYFTLFSIIKGIDINKKKKSVHEIPESGKKKPQPDFIDDLQMHGFYPFSR